MGNRKCTVPDNVFSARAASGTPTYLAFYYFHISASRETRLGLSFGDKIEVASRLFNFGSESILTLHKITRASGDETETKHILCDEFMKTGLTSVSTSRISIAGSLGELIKAMRTWSSHRRLTSSISTFLYYPMVTLLRAYDYARYITD